MSDSDDPIDLPEDGGDDLFGDDADEEEAQSDQGRVLSDGDLASDRDGDDRGARYGLGRDGVDDEDDDDGDDDDDDDNQMTEQRYVLPVPMYRHKTPKSKDGSVSLLLSFFSSACT